MEDDDGNARLHFQITVDTTEARRSVKSLQRDLRETLKLLAAVEASAERLNGKGGTFEVSRQGHKDKAGTGTGLS